MVWGFFSLSLSLFYGSPSGSWEHFQCSFTLHRTGTLPSHTHTHTLPPFTLDQHHSRHRHSHLTRECQHCDHCTHCYYYHWNSPELTRPKTTHNYQKREPNQHKRCEAASGSGTLPTPPSIPDPYQTTQPQVQIPRADHRVKPHHTHTTQTIQT